ncbi:hypothetical protein KSC_069550 [Ktedonobacter sp. SOSP1-52]|nr:hypothetical protein KSC_069550 [Ktedonobacter sp. SOSP1-52]
MTRLSPPRLPATLVVRERLLSALDTALSHPLTLLSASAGWGKTTLLSAWAHRHPQAVLPQCVSYAVSLAETTT